MEELKNNARSDDLVGLLHSTFNRYGLKPGFPAYSFIINGLIRRRQSCKLPPILQHLEEFESFETSERMFIKLIKTYGASNMLHEAVNMFFRIPKFRCRPTVRSLNSLLYVLCNKRGLELIPDVLLRTPELNLRLEGSSFMILMKALCEIGRLTEADELLEEIKLNGFAPDKRIYSMILSSLYEHFDSSKVLSYFDKMKATGVSLKSADYTCVLNTLVMLGRSGDAYGLLGEMRSDGCEPSVENYASVLKEFFSAGEFQKADELFDEMLLRGLCPDFSTYSAYIEGLCRQGKVEKGLKMLECMEKMGCRPDSATCHIVIGGCIKVGQPERAREIMKAMREKGFSEEQIFCDPDKLRL